MARIRSIHPGLFTDEEFVSVTDGAQVLYLGLLTEADDQGVFGWKPITLKMRLRPASNSPVDTLLAELVGVNKIGIYEIGGHKYGAIRNFRKYQRPKSPNAIHPLPDEWRKYVGLDGAISETGEDEPPPIPQKVETAPQREEGGDSVGKEGGGERAKSAALPPDWKLPDEWKVEAEKARERNGLPSVNLALAAERFAGHNEHTSRKNWRGAWLKWALDEHAGKGANGHVAPVPPGEPDPAKEAARIAGMIATMVKTGKRLFPMAVSDRQLAAACRANTLPRELLEQWFGPNTAAEMLR